MDSTIPAIAGCAGLLARAAEQLTALANKLASRRPPAPVPALAAPAAPSAYLDTKQAAAMLGISTKGLEAMRVRGRRVVGAW